MAALYSMLPKCLLFSRLVILMNIIKKTLIKFISMLKKLFISKNKKETIIIDYDATPEEKWICNSFVSPFSNARFEEEDGDGYRAFFDKETYSFVLELERKNLYAWVQNKFYRYKDFILEAKICIVNAKNTRKSNNEAMAGSSSVGWIFRNIEKAFYSILVSDAGFIRVDLIINNTPKTLIPWTEIIGGISDEFKISIISFDSSITCLINDCWVASVEDDTINASGKIAFAGQNYNQTSSVKFLLRNISINSHIIDVQNKYDEVNNEQNIKKEARRHLATSYYTIENTVAAINEIKNIEKTGLEVEDALLAGKIYFTARLIEKGEQYFLKALELSPSHKEARIQLLNLYYYSDQYEKLKSILDTFQESEFESSSTLCNIKAHYLHYIGSHYDAAIFYNKAFRLSQDQGLFAFNAGREYESDGNIEKAIVSYIEASNAFLKTKQYVDMGQALNALERIAKDDKRYWTISAKFYYAIEKYDDATRYLKLLITTDSKDADVWYLYALILQMKKDEGAIFAFEKAHILKPDESLYCFRYAESLYLGKKDCESYIKEAIRLDEKNGWAYNLYAMLMIDKNEVDKALLYITKARECLPSEISVFGNYIHIKIMKGELNYCYTLFGCASEKQEKSNIQNEKTDIVLDIAVEQNKAEAYYLFANELHQVNELEKAHTWYEKAIKLTSNNNNLLLDSAINSQMLGYLNEAQSYAVKALDISPSIEAYRLISIIAKEMGDYERSEASLVQALNEYGKNEELLFDLVNLFLSINKKEKAISVLQELKAISTLNSNRLIELEKIARS